MPLTTQQIGNGIRVALQKEWWCVRLLRAYNINRDASICAVQYHKFIFGVIIEAFVTFLVIDLYAITDINNRVGATFTIWLRKLIEEETDPTDLQSLQTLQQEYNEFYISSDYQGIVTRRNKIFAHRDQDGHAANFLPGNTYGDLFNSVDKLKNIYDQIVSMGEARAVNWSGPPDRSLYNTISPNIDSTPEVLMEEFMQALESATHDSSQHSYLNENNPTF